jgi:hypothetical protein
MTTTRQSPLEKSKTINFTLFLVTLPETAKSQDIFHLPSLCHIAIRVEAYRFQSALTQCHNCQKFGHVWANCKQPPRCLWCGGGHLHKECPEKDNNASTPACCNCKLLEGENPHPTNYRGCRHAKEELLKKNLREVPKLHREGCSHTVLHQVCLSRRSEVARNNISHKYSKIQRQFDPQQRKSESHLLQSLKDQVSQSVLKIKTVNLLTV